MRDAAGRWAEAKSQRTCNGSKDGSHEATGRGLAREDLPCGKIPARGSSEERHPRSRRGLSSSVEKLRLSIQLPDSKLCFPKSAQHS